MIEVEKKSFKERYEEKKKKAKEKFDDVKKWCGEHKSEIVVFGPVLITGAVEIIKTVSKRKNLDDEKALKDNYIYDRSMGHYYELKRKLKSSEWLQIEERKAEGETLGSILQDMRVLK